MKNGIKKSIYICIILLLTSITAIQIILGVDTPRLNLIDNIGLQSFKKF